ncbi:MAG: hypothetical protein WAO91_04250 [Candidatus Nitrosotenuis sp.]
MNYTVQIDSHVDEKRWNSQLAQNRGSTLYQSFNWLKVYQENIGSKLFFISVLSPNGGVVGQLAVLLHKNALRNENIVAKKLGSTLNLSSVLTWFYGPIIHANEGENEITQTILTSLDRLAKENNVAMIRGSSPPLETKFSNSSFSKYGYDLTPWATYVVDLQQKSDELYQKLDKKTRYDIKKSGQNKLEFQITEGPSYFKEFSELKNEEYERTRRKKSRVLETYKTEYEYLYKNGFHKVFLAKHKGVPIAGISDIIFNGNIVQHGVANTKTSLLGGSFVTWHAIEWAIENNHKTYDMGGINPSPSSEKEKNIDFFKSKWGGQKYEYTLYTKILSKTKARLSAALKNPRKILQTISS